MVVGFCVGVTGVGAGSLMTPILILLLKVEPHIAIGTDLLYAAISKFFGSLVHAKQLNVVWPIVLWLALGSIPASIITNYLLETQLGGAASFQHLLTKALGLMLIITGLSVICRRQIESFFEKYKRQAGATQQQDQPSTAQTWPRYKLIIMGVILGILVTLSSVGAGAFGLMALVLMFPQLPMIRMIGSDVVHAVFLTFIAGMGHLFTGNVDYSILGWLLVGSIPAIIVGTLVSGKLPEAKIRSILGVTLLLLGLSFVFSHTSGHPTDVSTLVDSEQKNEVTMYQT